MFSLSNRIMCSFPLVSPISCLRLLPCLIVPFRFVFPSITCPRRQFLRKMRHVWDAARKKLCVCVFVGVYIYMYVQCPSVTSCSYWCYSLVPALTVPETFLHCILFVALFFYLSTPLLLRSSSTPSTHLARVRNTFFVPNGFAHVICCKGRVHLL